MKLGFSVLDTFFYSRQKMVGSKNFQIHQELVVCDAASDRDSSGATEVQGAGNTEGLSLS